MNKKGQFFLIAAVVIVRIIITLSTVNITTKKPASETATFYDLSSEIKYESNRLIDHGVYASADISSSINSLIDNYSAANPDTTLTFIYGDKDSLKRRDYDPTSAGETTIAGASLLEQIIKSVDLDITDDISNGKIKVKLGEQTLDFNLTTGENFFIVLKKEVEEETLVAQQ